MIRAFILGAPGSGKGTLTKKLTLKHSISVISSGDLLRKNETFQSTIAKGDLVQDDVVLEIVMKELNLIQQQVRS